MDVRSGCALLSRTPRFSSAYRSRLRYNVSRWLRARQPCRLDDIVSVSFDDFRRWGLDVGLAPRSIESTVEDIGRIIRHSGRSIDTGRPLRCQQADPIVPTVDAVGRLYVHVDAATWPNGRCRWLQCERAEWWRAWIVTACWTGLRREDLRQLTWPEIGSRRRAKKTGRVHPIAPSDVLDRHLRPLRGMDDRVFGTVAVKQMLAGMHQIAHAAGIEPITCQQLRRFAIGQWSAANAEAGRIVHGCGLGVLSYYLSAGRVLESTAPSVIMPTEFLTPGERGGRRRDERLLINALRRASPSDRKMLVKMALKCG